MHTGATNLKNLKDNLSSMDRSRPKIESSDPKLILGSLSLRRDYIMSGKYRRTALIQSTFRLLHAINVLKLPLVTLGDMC